MSVFPFSLKVVYHRWERRFRVYKPSLTAGIGTVRLDASEFSMLYLLQLRERFYDGALRCQDRQGTAEHPMR